MKHYLAWPPGTLTLTRPAQEKKTDAAPQKISFDRQNPADLPGRLHRLPSARQGQGQLHHDVARAR